MFVVGCWLVVGRWLPAVGLSAVADRLLFLCCGNNANRQILPITQTKVFVVSRLVFLSGLDMAKNVVVFCCSPDELKACCMVDWIFLSVFAAD